MIILSVIKNLCDEKQILYINNKNIASFDGRNDIIAVICSRKLAKRIYSMNLPSLKFIQLTSAGFDNVPIDGFSNRGIIVANAGTVYSVPIAETVVYGILAYAKRLHKNPNHRRYKLTRGYSYITELYNKKILIMATGSIGTEVSNRLQSFGCEIYGYDPFCQDKPPYKKYIKQEKN